jgi:hypothetical protein
VQCGPGGGVVVVAWVVVCSVVVSDVVVSWVVVSCVVVCAIVVPSLRGVLASVADAAKPAKPTGSKMSSSFSPLIGCPARCVAP